MTDVRAEPARPGYLYLVRTGDWRELVGWVKRFDREGRLEGEPQVTPHAGDVVTVRVLVRDDTPPPQPVPRVGSVRVERRPGGWQVWATTACVAVVVAVCGVVGWSLLQTGRAAESWLSKPDNLHLVVGMLVPAAGIAVGIRWAHGRRQ